MSRRSFTLLEVVIALALLMMAAGAVSWKMRGAIARKKFNTDVSRIRIQLESCYRLAINTRADWRVELDCSEDRLLVKSACANGTKLVPFQPKALPIDPLRMIFNGKEADQLIFYFSPSGKVAPEGILEFSQISYNFHQELYIPEIFQRSEKLEKDGPTHPDDD